VAVEAGSVTRGLIESGGSFSVSLLDRTDREVVRRFVKPVREVELDGDEAVSLQGVPVVEVGGGPPRLARAVAWLECAVRSTDAGEGAASGGASHVLIVGEVTDAGATAEFAAGGPDHPVLSMSDTRMHYGG
jgi:flavin reductase (DIM6/NTAB) family NADH-FMN oxidoreductase RutF